MAPDPDPEAVAIAARIADGSAIDWAAEADAPHRAETFDELKLIADLAAIHRTPAETIDAALPLTHWGPLTLIAKIGEGRFGAVYRAWEERLQRFVALKLLHLPQPSSPSTTTQIIDEARQLARVRHPNVLTIYGAETIEGQTGIWTEFIEGRTLDELIAENGPLPAHEVLAIGVDVCQALTAVHQAGLLHRDIKAQNVMRETGGRIVLMDFGTSRELDVLAGRSGDLSGTPLYLAPEVLEGEPASITSDVYALAVLLFRLVTGEFPIPGRTLDEVRAGHREGRVFELRAAGRRLPGRLADAIERGLAKAPSARHASAREFEAALARVARVEALRAMPRRRLIAGIVVGSLMIVALGVVAWRVLHPPVQRTSQHTTLLVSNAVEFPITAAVISPDGKSLAYVEGGASIMIAPVAGGQPRQVQHLDQMEIIRVGWLPDSGGLVLGGSKGLWRTTADGGPLRLISSSGGLNLAVSPNGSGIAVLTNDRTRIQLMALDGRIVGEIARAEPRSTFGGPVAWSPDGQRLAYSVLRHNERGQQTTAIESRRTDGTGTTEIAKKMLAPYDLVWAPGRILFSRVVTAAADRDANDLWEIPVDERTGQPLGEPRQVWEPAGTSLVRLSLTRDGMRLAFLARRTRMDVDVADFDPAAVQLSGLHQAVLAETFNQISNWTPGGDAVLYRYQAGAESRVHRQDLNESEPQVIPGLPDDVEEAVESRDGAWTVFLQPGRSGPNVTRVPAHGGAPEVLFPLDTANINIDDSLLRCARRESNLCAVSAWKNGHFRLTPFDPATGRAQEEIALPLSSSNELGWDFSPDGREAIVLEPAGGGPAASSPRLWLIDLKSRRTQAITCDACAGAYFVTWPTEARAWIVTRAPLTSPVPASEVLYVDAKGHARRIYSSTFQALSQPLASPDGRRIAFSGLTRKTSVWLLEGF